MSPVLYVCGLDDGGPWFHPCRRIVKAMDAAGLDYDRRVFDRNRPFGLFTTGRRPELRDMTGQEKLPVMQLDDGEWVIGSAAILRWVAQAPPTPARS